MRGCAIPTETPTPPVDDPGETLAQQARALADEVRRAEERVQTLRRLRDRAIIGLVESGWSTRKIGRALGLTATQVSTVWTRHRPPRRAGRRPERPTPPGGSDG